MPSQPPLPAARPAPLDSALRAVSSAIRARNARIAVVDDDPTGTQTVRGVPVVTAWDEPELRSGIEAADPLFAILTNTRALEESRAVAINRVIGERLNALGACLGVEILAISRGDSTLRGHFPAEAEALAAGLSSGGRRIDAILVCPAFPTAGRVTVDDVHLVDIGGELRPVADTEYASDPVFGYAESNLTAWVRARAGADAGVASIALDDIRLGGADRVASLLLRRPGGARYVVVNAATDADLATVALGVELAEERGVRLVYRTGPSFVGSRAGRPIPAPLPVGEAATPGPGLLAVGSHTALTSAQLRCAELRHGIHTVELDVGEIVAGGRRAAAAVEGSAARVLEALSDGDAALATSRVAMRAGDGRAVSRAVADALVDVVTRAAAEIPIGWLLAKGGITSHDVVVRALRARTATVVGQLFPGQVSLWELGPESLRPGLRYVVFPGNVGDEGTLADALDRLGGAA